MKRDLTISQVSKQLKLSRQSLYNYMDKGLKYDVIAGRRYFNLEEVNNFANDIHDNVIITGDEPDN